MKTIILFLTAVLFSIVSIAQVPSNIIDGAAKSAKISPFNRARWDFYCGIGGSGIRPSFFSWRKGGDFDNTADGISWKTSCIRFFDKPICNGVLNGVGVIWIGQHAKRNNYYYNEDFTRFNADDKINNHFIGLVDANRINCGRLAFIYDILLGYYRMNDKGTENKMNIKTHGDAFALGCTLGLEFALSDRMGIGFDLTGIAPFLDKVKREYPDGSKENIDIEDSQLNGMITNMGQISFHYYL